MVQYLFFTSLYVLHINGISNFRLQAHLPLLEQQFSKPTVAGIISDGYSDFYNFSTGRRAVLSLHTVFQLLPRHDPIQMAIIFVRSLIDLNYNPKDKIILDFKLSPSNTPSFIWAVVVKDLISKAKEGRWDLVSKAVFSSLL